MGSHRAVFAFQHPSDTPHRHPVAGQHPIAQVNAGSDRGFHVTGDKGATGVIMTDFPAYKTLLTADLIPYARNSRTHSDAQIGKIAASIREFGFLNPIIVDGANGIIAGHGRVMAAQKMGLTELPVIEAALATPLN